MQLHNQIKQNKKFHRDLKGKNYNDPVFFT